MKYELCCKFLLIGLYQCRLEWNKIRQQCRGVGILYTGIACAGEVVNGRIRVKSCEMACWRSGWWLTTRLLVSCTLVAQNLKVIVHAWACGSSQGTSKGERDLADVIGRLLTAILKGRGSWGLGKHKCHSCFQEGSQVASAPSWEGDGANLPGWPVAWTGEVLWMLYTLTLARPSMHFLTVSLKPSWWHVLGRWSIRWLEGWPTTRLTGWWTKSSWQLVVFLRAWFWDLWYSTPLLTALQNRMERTLNFADDVKWGEQSVCWRAGLLFRGTSTDWRNVSDGNLMEFSKS